MLRQKLLNGICCTRALSSSSSLFFKSTTSGARNNKTASLRKQRKEVSNEGFGILSAIGSGKVGALSFLSFSRTMKSQISASSPTTNPQVAESAMSIKETFRKDYKPPPYLIESVKLNFNLTEEITTVSSKLWVVPNCVAAPADAGELLLNGRNDVTLKTLRLDGKDVPDSAYVVNADSLVIKQLPSDAFDLEMIVEIKPQENTELQGLYKSGGNYCTQCEADGFRGITYFLDRPDVMSKYEVRIEAEKGQYPVLLSNGNLIEQGDLENGRHYAIWNDPFLKPCYLFALVAGDLEVKEDTFVTMSNREVKLRLFAQKKNIDKVDHAMRSLKQAMKWDENRFGLEYDLDLFNVVAVDDFNMGAMENKSLNIFNSKLLLATPETATDSDFERVQGVIGHEYFHNWTGNRVTCRDWFQLTLKEGLTVFRDRQFTADLNSAPVKRISDVSFLRASQFNEDAGPLAHPIRPDSYVKMDNIYTNTVYRKGAEIIGLYQTLLGKDGFRKGMDLYFKRHDGHAVTCDDFLAAMADANNKDLSSLAVWYGQAGTPKITISSEYDSESKVFKMHVQQETPPTPGQTEKSPVLIPIAMALLDSQGNEMDLVMGDGEMKGKSLVLEFDTREADFEFHNVYEKPVLSALRNFSAPVRMTIEGQTMEDLIFLFANDKDPFNRWEAGQTMSKRVIFDIYTAAKNYGDNYLEHMNEIANIPSNIYDAFRSVLLDENLDGNFISLALSLPSPSQMIGDMKQADPLLLYHICNYMYKKIAVALTSDFEKVMAKNESDPSEVYSPEIEQTAKRSLKNVCLRYLAMTGDSKYLKECAKRYYEARNMTDTMAALSSLNDTDCVERTMALENFYEKWKDNFLVTLKWLTLEACSNIPGNLKRVKSLMSHEAYNISNPNCNYSLLMGFPASAINYHAVDGSGYEFLADAIIKVDAVNGSVASSIATVLSRYNQYDEKRQEMILKQLKRINETPGISDKTKEIVAKSIGL